MSNTTACLIAFFSLLLLPSIALAEDRERIDSFDAKIQLTKDKTLSVEESVDYDFGTNQRHGIMRFIPIRSHIKGKDVKIKLLPMSLWAHCDGKGVSAMADSNDERIQIKIGSHAKTLSGKHNFILKYSVSGAVFAHEGEPELHWNVTGDKWKVPIDRVHASFLLPDASTMRKVKSSAFLSTNTTGHGGEVVTRKDSFELAGHSLSPGDGLKFELVFLPNTFGPEEISQRTVATEQAALTERQTPGASSNNGSVTRLPLPLVIVLGLLGIASFIFVLQILNKNFGGDKDFRGASKKGRKRESKRNSYNRAGLSQPYVFDNDQHHHDNSRSSSSDYSSSSSDSSCSDYSSSSDSSSSSSDSSGGGGGDSW